MRATLHVGLAALLVIAPALCCCNLRWFAPGVLAASPRAPAHRAPPAVPDCCSATKPVVESCCWEHDATPVAPASGTEVGTTEQATPTVPHCRCAAQRPAGTLPQSTPVVSAPEPSGERLPVALLDPSAFPPEHLGLLGGLDPPERAGVDTLSESLFSRHVMRC